MIDLRMNTPGEIRLHHLSGPEEQYVLTEWLVDLGDKVVVGQTIAIVETESFTLEIQSFDSGVLAERNAIVGQTIRDGALAARIRLSDPEVTSD